MDALDYYVVRGDGAAPVGLIVEEFVLADDGTAAGLGGAGWVPTGGWTGSAALSRALRVDAAARARITPVVRHDAGLVYRQLGGGDLPDEATLRTHFDGYAPAGAAAPLRLGGAPADDEFRERRLYRVLFAGGLAPTSLAQLQAGWRMSAGDDPVRVVGRAQRSFGPDLLTWELRRVGPGVAWAVDLTARLAGESDRAVRPLLRELMTVLRGHGLIPVTVERFA